MSKSVKLTKDGKTVTALKPTTVTRLKSQGWKVVEAAKAAPKPVLPEPSKAPKGDA